jgi:hypothetical protein
LDRYKAAERLTMQLAARRSAAAADGAGGGVGVAEGGAPGGAGPDPGTQLAAALARHELRVHLPRLPACLPCQRFVPRRWFLRTSAPPSPPAFCCCCGFRAQVADRARHEELAAMRNRNGLLVKSAAYAKGNSKALPGSFTHKASAATGKHGNDARRRSNVHHSNAHYHGAGSKQFQR